MIRFTFLLTCIGLIFSPAPVGAENLFDDASYKPLVVDHRSFKKGDILTVLIYETSSASASASSGANKKAGVGLAASDGHTTLQGNVDISNDFDGKGTMARAGQLVASVSVTITDILKNGDMEIFGEQLIEFNNEKQFISVEGKVRPLDIGPQNTVISSRLADSKIKYLGEGLLSNGEKPGIITRIINWLF